MLKFNQDAAGHGQPLPKLAFTRREAAHLISQSPATLDRLVQRGLLHPSRATRRPLFSREELERFLRETTATC
jgi:hypothetical protein